MGRVSFIYCNVCQWGPCVVQIEDKHEYELTISREGHR